MSWDDLQSVRKMDVVRDEESEKLAAAFTALFSGELGQVVLEGIRQRTEAQSTLPGRAMDGQAMSVLMGVREGEDRKSVV